MWSPRRAERDPEPPHGTRRAVIACCLSLGLLLSAAPAQPLNVARTMLNNQLADGIHYEHHLYYMVGTILTEGDALVDPVLRRPPSSSSQPFSNLTIESAAENQVVREFVQPELAWLPLFTGADGQPTWLVYDEASGAVVEKPAPFVNTASSLSGQRLALGGCLDQGGRWAPPATIEHKAALVLKVPTRDRGTFKFGESYYHVERLRRSLTSTHPTANLHEFLSYPGKVASIETAAENAFLASVLRDMGIDAAWTGAVRSSVNSAVHRDVWAWGTVTDGTRLPSLMGETFPQDSCIPEGGVQFFPGVFHNFSNTMEPCGNTLAGAVLHNDGRWSTSVGPIDRYATITEFGTSRNLSGEVLFRDKAFRVEAVDEPFEAARATAELARYDFLPSVTLQGHLPVPDSFGEALLLAQMAVAARPSACTGAQSIRRSTRAFLGFEFLPGSLELKAAYGPLQGVTAGFTANSTFLPTTVEGLLPSGVKSCVAAEGPAYRFGDCSLGRSVTIAEFNLNAIEGRFYVELGIQATAFGLQQLIGSRRGALVAHGVRIRTEAQLQVFHAATLRGGFGFRNVHSARQAAGDPFRWPDGRLVGANLSAGVPALSGGQFPLCLSVRGVRLPVVSWLTTGCTSSYTPLTLEYSSDPTQPAELALLPPCATCSCTPPTLACAGTGLTSIPAVPNASTYLFLFATANHVPRLTRAALQYPNLRTLSFFANVVGSVDDDAFSDCPHLNVLDLSLNALTEIPMLQNLALTELSLSDNSILRVRPEALPPTLKELALDINFITEIAAGSFDKLTRLLLLNLNSNPITMLSATAFHALGQSNVFLSDTPCACLVEAGVLTRCPASCHVPDASPTTTTLATPTMATLPAGSGGSSVGVIIGAGAAALVAAVLLVLLVLWRRRAARSTKVQVDPRGAWSDDASSSALCAGDMSSFAVAEEEAVTALMGARISQDSLELGQPLGSGAFGEVFRGRGRSGRIAGMEVAVKTLATTERDARDVFMKEASLQLELQHPHIVTLLGVCMNPGRGPMIVMELMPRGDLRQHLVKETASGRAPETAALTSWCEQVCSAVAYLETKRILHRDIAARNVLLSGELVAKLADLGLARTLSGKDYYRKLSDDRVPLKWMAPESIVDKVYVIRSDVWSFGVLLFETFSLGGKPYPNMTAAETVKFVLGGNRLPAPFGMPEEIARLMQHCWQHEPYARPSFAELHAGLVSLTNSNEEESVL